MFVKRINYSVKKNNEKFIFSFFKYFFYISNVLYFYFLFNVNFLHSYCVCMPSTDRKISLYNRAAKKCKSAYCNYYNYCDYI